MKRFLVCGGDIGGMNDACPVGRALMALGHEVSWLIDPHPDAKAGLTLERAGIAYETKFPTSDMPRPDLVLMGTSATATNLQLIATHLARDWWKVPVVWVEDFPGTGNYKINRSVSPTVFCTMDEVAASYARSVRPGLDVCVCGKPSYAEAVAPLIARKNDIRNEVRAALGIAEHDFVIMWSGGSPIQEDLVVVEALCSLGITKDGRVPILLDRMHPKTPVRDRAEIQQRLDRGNVVNSYAEKQLERVALASDLIVCTWGSTVQFCAALGGIPVILTMSANDHRTCLELGYVDGVPPLVRAKAGLVATDSDDLKQKVAAVMNGGDQCLSRETMAEGAKTFLPWIGAGATQSIVDVCLEQLAAH